MIEKDRKNLLEEAFLQVSEATLANELRRFGEELDLDAHTS